MAILKYLGMLLYAARAARAETEDTPLVPLVSIRELHEDFSGKVEDATCARIGRLAVLGPLLGRRLHAGL